LPSRFVVVVGSHLKGKKKAKSSWNYFLEVKHINKRWKHIFSKNCFLLFYFGCLVLVFFLIINSKQSSK
jgi:hypothetical protein